MRNIFFFFGTILLVDGVFGDDVTVMEGDSVTLKPDTVIPEDDTAQWWFGDKLIAKINKADGLFSTSKGDDVGFKGKLELDHQTGSLTITNTRTNHTGPYKLQIKTATAVTSKIFSVTVRTVTGDMKTVSVKKGETCILQTGLILQKNDLIMWKFKEQLIAENNTGTDSGLYLDRQSGSLIIIKSKITDSGDYQLDMNSSSHTLKRSISVTVSGVFGGDVTVMEGDSVTLKPDTVIPEDDSAQWWFGDTIIAKINKAAGLFSTSEGPDGIFRDRLKLDHQTGSLTITNTRTNHTGLYKLQIKTTTGVTSKIFSVTVRRVFGETVIVMEGDSVSLKPHTVIPEDDSAQWWFGDTIIARINKAVGLFSTSEGDNVGFNGRLKLDHQTGSLTITHTRTDHTGLYKLLIWGRTGTFKIFNVTVRSGDVKSLSVTEGDSVTLHTGVTDIQRDQILWKFGDQDLNSADARWNNTDLNGQTGDLNIRNIRKHQYGDYEVKIKNENSLILHKKFRISTHDSDMSAGAIAGIVVGVLLVFAAAVAGVIYRRWKISKLKRPTEVSERNGTNDPLRDETANSDHL